jgi:ribonucleoside-diphosphate reductase beta chain
MRLYHAYLQEHPEIDRAALNLSVQDIARDAVHHEHAFIDLAFEAGDVPGMTRKEIKDYIEYLANIRLKQLGVKPIFKAQARNPLPWMDMMLNGVEHANFFEARPTEYSKAATTGDWGDVWS